MTALKTIFYWDFGIAENAKDDAAKIFRSDLEFLHLVGADNLLLLGTNQTIQHETPIVSVETETPKQENNTPPQVSDKHKITTINITPETSNKPKVIPPSSTWVIKESEFRIGENRYVKITFPDNWTNDEIEKFCTQLKSAYMI